MSGHSRVRELVQFLASEGRCERHSVLVRMFGRRAVDAAVADGHIVSLVPRIYADARHAAGFETRVIAADYWLPDTCAVTGMAALALFELAESAPATVTVLVPRNTHLRAPDWMRVVRTDPQRTFQFPRGVRCATRERALIDAWCEAPERDRVSVVLEAMRRSNMSGAAVLRTLAKMPRVKDRRALERLLLEASEGIQSYLEHRARRTVLNTSDFRGLKRQVEFVAMGNRYVVDTFDAATRTVIEFDGAKIHGTRAAKKRDNQRDAALLTLGVATIRVGYDDVMRRPEWCRQVIRRALAAR